MPIIHKLDTSEIHALLTSPTGPVAKDMIRRGLKVESAAKRRLGSNPRRVDTGRLRASITTQLISYNGRPAVRVGTNVKYARYVHDGTGIFGPYSEVIRPKTKKALSWVTKGKGRKKGNRVFAKYVIGMRPNPFLKDALKAARG